MFQAFLANMEVGRRGREPAMTEQPLKGQQVDTGFQQMGCKRVTQRMYSASIGQSHTFHRLGEGPLHGVLGDMTIGINFAGKQPVLRTVEPPRSEEHTSELQ